MLQSPYISYAALQSFCGVILAIMLSPAVVFADGDEPNPVGRQIYEKRCLECHGEQGQGVEGVYSQPLLGDLSIMELSRYISKTMPEGDPEACTGSDAEEVARYIHHAFYSVTAQARNRKARIELSRLTVDQYRNSVIDLVRSFGPSSSIGTERGLRAEYFKSKRRKKENRVAQRVDRNVDFSFGKEPEFLKDLIDQQKTQQNDKEEAQGKDDKKPTPVQEEYAVTWRGSLYAPETGEYVINFKTKNSGQLWFNQEREPLIDARVKSGDQTDYTARVTLQAGRTYDLRVDYFKNKTEQEGFVQLRWKRPHHTEEVIAPRYLLPQGSPWLLTLETSFPPDDKSVGYERGTSVSAEWNDATTYAALEVADKVLQRISELADLAKDSESNRQKLIDFSRQFAERAFRRPLSDREQDLYIDRQFEQADNDLGAVKRVVILVLKSPRFLFPGAAQRTFDDYRVAEWLALSLWDSLPDRQLYEQAAAGQLSNRAQMESQVQRMLSDERAFVKIRGFFRQWLNTDHYHDLSKSEELYPEYSPELLSDLRTSLDLFIEQVVRDETSDYRKLLTGARYPLNRELAEYYGLNKPVGDHFEMVSLDPEHRSGLLTHPFLLAGLAYDDASSPIHRGVFLSRSLLGRFLKPPPEAVAPLPVDLHPGMTTRERVAMQTSSETCMACHGMINQLGFSLENFDAVGRFRKTEHNKPVDSSGQYIDRNGEVTRFQGPRELAAFLIQSPEAHDAFVEQFFQYLNKQPIQAFGRETLQQLRSDFIEHDFHIRHLMGQICIESVLAARRLNKAQAQ